MDFKDIEKIVRLMDKHGLSTFKLQQGETNLELNKGGGIDVEAVQKILASAPAAAVTHAPPAIAPASPAAPSSPAPADSGALAAGVEEISAPMVGTFFAAPNPDSPPFVKVGDKVEPDTVICIVEAMKVMNEIKAEVSGEIVEMVAENGQSVGYGDPLFRIKTS